MSFENKELEISLHHETEHTHHHNILDDSDLDHDHHSANHKSDHVIKELPDYTNAAGQIPTITPNFILINSYNYLYELNLFPTDNESYSNFKQIESPPDSITLLKTTVIRI